jgi:glycosyltransferase involved in cell wall biosynthesis
VNGNNPGQVFQRLTTVSVVVAAFNEQAHIERLLDSLRRQTHRLAEVIVVDDGSTDQTAQLAKRAGATVISTSHRGPARARNHGATVAKGDIVVFLDGDMATSSCFIQRLIDPILAGRAGGTFSKDMFIGNPENTWSRCYARIRRHAFPRVIGIDFPDRWANYRALPRSTFLAVGGYDDVGYGEDMTLAPKLGELALAAPGATCFHFNPDSLFEIFENARWIGRGHDIAAITHPWLTNSPWHALADGIRELRLGESWHIVPARLAYHFGITVGLVSRRLSARRHAK